MNKALKKVVERQVDNPWSAPVSDARKDVFWSRTKPIGDCLNWTGQLNRNGYGAFCYNGRSRPAHRVAWVITRGSIPVGINVLHRCDNPTCVNPKHLFLGTQLDNIADMVTKERHNHKEKHPMAKLTENQAIAIRELRKLGWQYDDLAQVFGVHKGTIGYICRNQLWKDKNNA